MSDLLPWIDRAAYEAYRAFLGQPEEAVTRADWNVQSVSSKKGWRRVVIAVLDELADASFEMCEAARKAGFRGLSYSDFTHRFQAAIFDVAQALREEERRNPITNARK